MLGHLGVNVTDLSQARRYYHSLMPLLGFESFLDGDDQFAYRPANGKPGTYLFFYPAQAEGSYSAEATGLQHLAFMVPTRSRVHAVHQHVLTSGGEVVHEPAEYPRYPGPYYAVFWRDPFGIMLEAVCHHDRE